MRQVQVLMVCLGNICRSPTAHGVFERKVREAGLSHSISVSSAGTSDWHVGKPPDKRSQLAALERGYDLSLLRGQQVTVSDFEQFDYILAMDNQNLASLLALKPAGYTGKLCLFLDFGTLAVAEVPDPYHGGSAGFEEVLDLVEDAANGLLGIIRDQLSR